MRAASHYTERYRNYDAGNSILTKLVVGAIILFFTAGLLLGAEALEFLTSWTY